MVPEDMPFTWSDAWVLLSIALASRDRPASLRDIIATGDALDHAILTAQEIRRGLAKLTAARYVVEQDGGFVACGPAADFRIRSEARSRSLHELFQETTTFLGVVQPPAKNHPRYEDPSWPYPSITDEAVQAAYDEYNPRAQEQWEVINAHRQRLMEAQRRKAMDPKEGED